MRHPGGRRNDTAGGDTHPFRVVVDPGVFFALEAIGFALGLQREPRHDSYSALLLPIAVDTLIEALLRDPQCGPVVRCALGALDRARLEDRLREQVDPDQVATLLDLADAGDRERFFDLARMLGVTDDDLEALWTGTRRRILPGQHDGRSVAQGSR